jgi:hypothetical protein
VFIEAAIRMAVAASPDATCRPARRAIERVSRVDVGDSGYCRQKRPRVARQLTG